MNAAATPLSVTATGAGLTYQWYSNTTNSNTGGALLGGAISSTYTPVTTTAGTLYYYVIVSGTCTPAVTSTVSGAVTVNANSTIVLTSTAAGTNAQTICINTALTNITYAIGGGGTGATVTGLPAGITGIYSAGVFTISGTPSVSGTFNYTVTTAGPCVNSSLSGTITVNANSTISLSSAAGTNAQTICINTALTNIIYTIAGGGTGATVTGLPAGITGSYSAGVYTISGKPNVSGIFNYTVTTTGPCVNLSIGGTITVNANSTITLTSAATTSQTICINTALTNITYAIGGGGTGATITAGALPAGVSGSYSAGVFTISGIPTASGTFSYTVTTAGPCVNLFLSGTITVNANSTITLSSGTNAQTICINTPLANITYSIGGGGTGATVTGLPTGITGTYSAGVYTISGTPTVPGVFSYTVTTAGPCINNSLSGSISVDPVSVGGTLTIAGSPATPFNSITLCPPLPGSPNTATINLGTHVGTVTWQSSTNGGTDWISAVGTATQNSLMVSNVPTTTIYRAFVKSGPCTQSYSNIAIAVVIPPLPPDNIIATPPIICLGQSSTLTSGTGLPPIGIPASSGGFNNGASDDKIWTVRYFNGSVFVIDQNALNAGADNGAPTYWRESNGTKYLDYNSLSGKFAITHGIYNTTLESPIFSLAYQTAATLTFSQAYNFQPGDSGRIEFSTDGGTTYNTVPLVPTYTGALGPNTGFAPTSIDLSQYIGLSNLRFRFHFYSNSINSVWAVDNLSTPSTSLPINYTWSGTILNTTSGSPVIAIPTSAGITTYTINTTIGSCPGGSGTVQVTALIPASFTAAQQPQPSTVCVGNTTSFTGTPSGDNLVYKWERSADNGITWSTLTNAAPYTIVSSTSPNSSQLSIAGAGTAVANVDDLYRLTANNVACGAAAVPVPMKLNYVWKGNSNINWYDATNWAAGVVPDINCTDVYILGSRPNQPTIDYLAPGINNLRMLTGGRLTINATGTLQVAGHIYISDLNSITARNGSLNMNAPTTLAPLANQSIDANTFFKNDLNNLNLDKNGARTITLNGVSGDTLNLYGVLSFTGGGNKNFVTNDVLILKSLYVGTANVADMNNGGTSTGNTITGQATVERFINTGTSGNAHAKSWQFVAAPITTAGQTVKQSWMENQVAPPPTGYGTWVTSNLFPAGGFDAISVAPSMKYYQPAVPDSLGTPDSWLGISSISVPVNNAQGYMLFVRGDRNIKFINALANVTTLRAKGPLYQPNTLPPVSIISPKLYQSIGNPYASAIDLTKMISGGGFVNLNNDVTVWDPYIGGRYAVGGYQTLAAANNYVPTVSGTTTYPAGVSSPYIQSGQAFFVKSSGAAGTATFSEGVKLNGSRLVNRVGSGFISERNYFRVSLYTGSGLVADGNAVVFSTAYSNKIDADDAYKLGNGGENLGISRNGISLAVEARSPVTESDTVFYRMWNLGQQSYQLRFAPENMERAGVSAELIDKYLEKRMPVGLTADTTYYAFSITSEAASKAADRFMVVFKEEIRPLTFTSVKAYQKNRDIAVEWKVENERLVNHYEVAKSVDGRTFTKVDTVATDKSLSGSFNWLDVHAVEGFNYYRIKSVNFSGESTYSDIVKVFMGSLKPLITIYPNPVRDGVLNLQFANEPQGNYGIRLLNNLGQIIVSKQVTHAGGNSTQTIKWDYNLVHGVYHLEVFKPDGGVKVIKVLY